MNIRSAKPEDTSKIAAISREFGYEPTEDEVAASLRDLLPRIDHVVLVAEDEGAVIAWGHARINRHIEIPQHAELVSMVVTRASRSQGIGSAIVSAVEQWAREQGERSLRVRSSIVRERAHKFYLREGYTEVKQQKTFVKTL
jgi:GNAT superfamily N-acetyltransferase